MGYRYIFLGSLTSLFFSSSTPLSSLPALFLSPSSLQEILHCCFEEAQQRGLLCPCCMAAYCALELSWRGPKSRGSKQDYCPLRGAWPAASPADRSPPRKVLDTALEMLVQQIHAAWQKDDGVASLLSLDMSGAYDRVVPSRLSHNLRKRSHPQGIVNYISSFLSDRSTSLCVRGFALPDLPY